MCICWLRQYNNLQLRCNIDVKHAEISRSVTTHATSQEVSSRLYNTKPNPDIKWSDQIVKSEYSNKNLLFPNLYTQLYLLSFLYFVL